MRKINPPATPEQAVCIDYFMTGESMRDIAFAGAGKTSTLTGKARTTSRRGLYIAFNKAIASDASLKFPFNVRCSTAHSLAYREVISRGFSGDKMSKSPRSAAFDLAGVTDKIPFHQATFRSAVAGTLRRFCQSDAREITERHVPRVDGMAEEHQEFLYAWAPIAAADTWNRMVDPDDDLPMGHDGYLKLWSLGDPRLPADFVMIDEAQDLNPVLIHVVQLHRGQTIAVGDPHQQIYEWRGARDALGILGGREFRLTMSFRFGAAIAATANRVLTAMGETVPLIGNPLTRDTVASDRPADIEAVLCRSNAGVIDQAVGYLDRGRGVATPGGTGEMRSWIEDAEALQLGAPARSAEFMGFETWKAVQDYSQTDEGAGLKVFVGLIDKYRPRVLRRVLDQIKDKAGPGDVTISTAHKGKGLEWSSVAIHDDFFAGDDQDGEGISMSERRLFYVALTRAKHALYVDPDTVNAYAS